MFFTCKDALGGQEFASYTITKDELTFGNLITMKSGLGYASRDYLYYKKRCGNAVATLKEIQYDDDANAMVTCNSAEREVRLVLSRDQITERNVQITPIKLPRISSITEDDTDGSVDDYKKWLKEMHEEGKCLGKRYICCCPIVKGYFHIILHWQLITNISIVLTDFKDIFRNDTVCCYKEWLIVQGELDDICNIISFPKL